MNAQPALILVFLHVCLALACIALIIFEKISLRKEYIIPVVLLPVFGPVAALTIELLRILSLHAKTPLPIDLLTPQHDILWKALKSYHENGNIVPLEEAILIDDVKTRRKFMLETLYEDPLKYLDILMLAKNNDDVETSHYATTTISRAQRDFQLAIQKLAVAVENRPEDMAVLDKYIDTLGKYIGSGLLEEHLLRNLRVVYQDVLDRKLTRAKNDKLTLIRKLRNSIELHDYATALKVSNYLREHWPEDEQTWIEAVRVCVEGKDHKRLSEILNGIQNNHINWTKHGKEQVSAWVEGMMP
ncbi:MAG TPA: hypothetical protein VK897_26165 [Anaerolineales bacterium]|nr:hypothetical protein [Anaerolineales bacterium]